VKYNTNGDELWARRYNGPGNGWDEAHDVVVDALGNVYVTGQSKGSGTGLDYATVKYNAAGEEQWVDRYNGAGNGEDIAKALTLDKHNNVYVTGVSVGSDGLKDIVTIKYSKEAQPLSAITRREEEPGMFNSLDEITTRFRISHYPNPVMGSAKINYDLPYDGQVSIRLFDVLGREVAVITNQSAKAGSYNTSLDVSNLKKGIYYYRLSLQKGNKVWTQTNKMTVVK
jgi:hypothetical protein